MTARLIQGLSYDDYAAIEAVRWSLLKVIDRTPLHCHYAEHNPSPDTAAKLLGRAVHCAVLEPDRFNDAFPVMPDFSGKGSVAERKEWKAALTPGATALSDEDAEQALAMARAIEAHTEAAELLGGAGYNEVVALWNIGALACKARLDRLHFPEKGTGVVIEIKTAVDAEARAFGRQAANIGYLKHAAWAQFGLDQVAPARRRHVFIAVEKEPPYAVAVYWLDQAVIDHLQPWVIGLAERYHLCAEKNEWPGYESGPLAVPAWVMPSEKTL
jgi:hypothetical protein